jgi:glycosyltransferase involved in cell wall biosynthesis
MPDINRALISIIIPCYNQGQYLNDALASVLEQEYTNWECLIVNDGSPDNTKEIAAEWVRRDSRFIYLEKINGGLSSARNHGLDNAKGDYIQFLDADDTIEPGKLQAHIDELATVKEHKVITYSPSRYFNGDITKESIFRGNVFSHAELTIYDKHADHKKMIFSRNVCVVSAPLYPVILFSEIGQYDEQFPSFEDWDLNMRAVLHGYKFHYIGYTPGARTMIRVSEQSMLTNKNTMNIAWNMLLEKHREAGLYQHWVGDTVATPPKLHMRIAKGILPPVLFRIANRISGK